MTDGDFTNATQVRYDIPEPEPAIASVAVSGESLRDPVISVTVSNLAPAQEISVYLDILADVVPLPPRIPLDPMTATGVTSTVRWTLDRDMFPPGQYIARASLLEDFSMGVVSSTYSLGIPPAGFTRQDVLNLDNDMGIVLEAEVSFPDDGGTTVISRCRRATLPESSWITLPNTPLSLIHI